MSDTESIRALLIHECDQYVQQRIDNAQQAMSDAQAAANHEEKSSAGDKYETGRAMAQIARDQAALQLMEAQKLKSAVERIRSVNLSDRVGPGSLVQAGAHHFFLSIPAGKLTVGGKDFLFLSPASPLGSQLVGKKQGDTISIMGKQETIHSIG